MRLYFRTCLAAAALTGLGFLLPATGLAQPPKSEPAVKGPAAPMPKTALGLKVFKLQRANPEAVVAGLSDLLEQQDDVIPMPVPPGGVPIPRGGFGVIGDFTGGGQIGFGGGTAVPVWRATVEPRTNSVIVRGGEKHLKVAADLVALLDRPANAPLPQLQMVRAFALKHAEAADLAQVIEALAFDGVKFSSPAEKLLAVVGPDDATKAIAELVKELDVPGKPPEEPKKTEEPKREPEKKE